MLDVKITLKDNPGSQEKSVKFMFTENRCRRLHLRIQDRGEGQFGSFVKFELKKSVKIFLFNLRFILN